MISPSTIDKVRDLSIVDVVGKFVPDLKKSGANYSAKSPFANEKSASFFVVPAKQIFKCFSSGKGGDGIKFVMEHEKMEYIDAIKTLCAEFSIQIEYESNGLPKEHYDEIELLYKMNKRAAQLYAEQLLTINGNHPAFTELINKRRFSPDTLAQWEIGYAPGEVSGEYTPGKWNFLAKQIISSGRYQQGIDLGIIKTKGDVNYDTFRNRIIFPIIDHHARYVGFGARALVADKYNAKYLNSSDSKVFNKSQTLFGLHFAGHAIRKVGYANLMEGYTDVISFHQAGQNNTVGTCGTSLTEDQAKLLRKYTKNVVMIGDPDEAGQNAMQRNIDILIPHGFEVSVVPMPSIVQLKRENGKQPWREAVFITQRTKESIWCKYNTADVEEIPLSNVEAIEKVDPDELVRMF